MASYLGIYEFGKQLVTTNDLDPVYVLVQDAGLAPAVLDRWLLAYWCFYHVGTASWIVDQQDYWGAMRIAAGSKEYKRASERRHFRGSAAVKSVTWLKDNEIDLTYFREVEQITLADCVAYVKSWYGFGDWIAFKVADMVERLGITKVIFQPADIFCMFDSPREGAQLMAHVHGPANDDVFSWAYTKLSSSPMLKLTAPPRHERYLNIQELETILCKWKSHRKGGYIVGKDIKETQHALEWAIKRFPEANTTAKSLMKAGGVNLW
jgi:Alpha-glutamyl/putrescinyl thymine pyrophosphorylase clade 2